MKNPFQSKLYRYNRPKKRRNEEGILQLHIIHYLKAKGAIVGKIKTKGAFSKGSFLKDPTQWTGLPDLLLFTPQLVFLEVKAPKGRLSESQRDFREFCLKAAIPYHVIRSMEDIESLFP